MSLLCLNSKTTHYTEPKFRGKAYMYGLVLHYYRKTEENLFLKLVHKKLKQY